MNAISQTPGGRLVADEQQIRTFVGCMFRYADAGTLVGLRSFTHDKDDQIARIQGWPRVDGDNDALVAAAVRAATESANNPVGRVFAPPVATFHPNQDANEKQRARLADLANGLCISVELDEGDTSAFRRKLEHLLGPATVVVASGGVWTDPDGVIHDKLHLRWRLSEPTRAPEEHAKLKEARDLAALLVGADRTAVPLVHPLRWPGSWHCKGTPRPSKITASSPAAEVHLDDALATLQETVEASGLKLSGKDDGPHTPGQPQAASARVASAVMAIPNLDTTPWDECNRLGLLIHRSTAGSSAGLDVWINWSQRSGKYVAGACQARWEHFHAHPYGKAGFGTIYHMARACGWTEARSRPAQPENLDGVGGQSDDDANERAAAEAGSHADIL